MVTVDYSASGFAIRDSYAVDFAEMVKGTIERGEDKTYDCGNAVAISALRALVAEGKIDSKKLQITFNGEPIGMDHNAIIKDWKEGFCDTEDALISRIITANIEAYRKEKSEKSVSHL